MGNPKQKWTSEEEEALRAGVAKHGPGKWKLIQKDPDFNVFLHSRSNIDLKDKWRNMSAAVQGGSRDKLRIPRPAKPAPPLDSAPIPTPADEPTPPAAAPAVQASASNNNNNNNNNQEDLPDPKNGPRYNDFIFQALSESPTGLDISSIVSFIEQRTEVPPNFRKPLGARLRRLVHQDKLHKVDSLYRLKNKPIHTNSTNRKDNSSKHHLPPVYSKAGESLEEAAKTAAFKVVEAETKSYAAAQAVKEADNFSILAEEADSILQFAQHIFDRCSRGELVLVA